MCFLLSVSTLRCVTASNITDVGTNRHAHKHASTYKDTCIQSKIEAHMNKTCLHWFNLILLRIFIQR